MGQSLEDVREQLGIAWKTYRTAKDAFDNARASGRPVETTRQAVLDLIPDVLAVLADCEEIDANDEEEQ